MGSESEVLAVIILVFVVTAICAVLASIAIGPEYLHAAYYANQNITIPVTLLVTSKEIVPNGIVTHGYIGLYTKVRVNGKYYSYSVATAVVNGETSTLYRWGSYPKMCIGPCIEFSGSVPSRIIFDGKLLTYHHVRSQTEETVLEFGIILLAGVIGAGLFSLPIYFLASAENSEEGNKK